MLVIPRPDSAPPTAALLGCQIDRTNILNERKIVDKPNAWPTPLQGPKIQYGLRSPSTVILTFFLWEITQKKFFLAKGFHILATRKKNNFCHPGGSHRAPDGLLASFRIKNAYFGTNVQKNQNFLAF